MTSLLFFMVMRRTVHQNKIMFALFNKLRFDDDMRHELAANISNDRTNSTALLTVDEADELIALLQTLVVENDPLIRMQRKLLYYAHRLGWELSDGKVDMDHVNAWCRKYGKYHKELNQHNYSETLQLLNQFSKFARSYSKPPAINDF